MTSFDFLAQGVGIELSLGDDFLLGGASLGLVFATLAVIAYVRRQRLSRVILVNAALAIGFVVFGVVGEAGAITLTAFITVCVCVILGYAALVRLVDPLARPLRGDPR